MTRGPPGSPQDASVQGRWLPAWLPPACPMASHNASQDARPAESAHEFCRNAGAVRHPLGLPDHLVGEVDEAVTDGPGGEGANGLLVAGLAEEALASPEHERVYHQPQLVDQVMLHQCVHELTAGVDDDFPVELLLQLRDLV